MKRQVARFRVYGFRSDGTVVRELTAADAAITWTVHLANKKAAWYRFELAMDIPDALGPPPLEVRRRNSNYVGSARRQLVIDPGPRSISGRNRKGSEYQFDAGTFLGARVPLGEVRTDAEGHLLVFGGFGNSQTPFEGNLASALANNDGWYDDVSDGPVSASVVLGGKVLEVESAWVIVAPPNFAPGIKGVLTLYDLALSAYLEKNPCAAPEQVSFRRHVYPIFQRLYQHQWVNEGFYLEYGWQAPGNFLDPPVLANLCNNHSEYNFLRYSIFKRFRNPDFYVADDGALPPIYGDAMDVPPKSPRQYLALTRLQYRWLEQWARGNFVSDWCGNSANKPQNLEAFSLQDQPSALDEAALECCLGGPFRPGIEAPWPLRRASMYSGLCRLNVRPSDVPEPDYGDTLTPSILLDPNGPLSRSGPGDITRWLSVPWQADVAACRFGFRRNADPPLPNPYLPAFWPARIPNHVLTQESLDQMKDTDLDKQARIAAFRSRKNWLRSLDPNPRDPTNAINEFISTWSQFGLVTRQDGPTDLDSLPAVTYAETERSLSDADKPTRVTAEQRFETRPRTRR
jgi:hypothetical protein